MSATLRGARALKRKFRRMKTRHAQRRVLGRPMQRAMDTAARVARRGNVNPRNRTGRLRRGLYWTKPEQVSGRWWVYLRSRAFYDRFMEARYRWKERAVRLARRRMYRELQRGVRRQITREARRP